MGALLACCGPCRALLPGGRLLLPGGPLLPPPVALLPPAAACRPAPAPARLIGRVHPLLISAQWCAQSRSLSNIQRTYI